MKRSSYVAIFPWFNGRHNAAIDNDQAVTNKASVDLNRGSQRGDCAGGRGQIVRVQCFARTPGTSRVACPHQRAQRLIECVHLQPHYAHSIPNACNVGPLQSSGQSCGGFHQITFPELSAIASSAICVWRSQSSEAPISQKQDHMLFSIAHIAYQLVCRVADIWYRYGNPRHMEHHTQVNRMWCYILIFRAL